MKNRNGFSVVEIIIVLIIFSIIVICSLTSALRDKKNFGRQIESPIPGQKYLVTAADAKMNLVVVMPYKFYKDDTAKTDRRLLLKVSNPYVCSNGVWFTETKDRQELIISSPIETNTPERTVYY